MAIPAEPTVLPLWPDGVPGSEEWPNPEQETPALPPFDIMVVRNVAEPTLTVYLPNPAIATGTAVVVCPGGAFHFLAIEHEGIDVAHWLNARGVAAFVLRYRLVPTEANDEDFKKQVQANMSDRTRMNKLMEQYGALAVADGQQAIRLVRQRAAEWGIAPSRVGIMGFSAGGVVTTGAAAQYDADSRPAFAAPIYAAPWNVEAVPADAPPLFIAVASDDRFAMSAGIPLYTQWATAGHSAELHIYAQGGHGFGMRVQNIPTDQWIDRFGEWLRMQGFI